MRSSIALAVVSFATFVAYVHGMDPEAFLRLFGHLPELEEGAPLTLKADLREGLLSYQKSMGLPQTGELDEATEKEMNSPRCGSKDIVRKHGSRRKRFSAPGDKWRKNDLTYRISIYTNDLPRSTVDSEIARALKVWSDVTPLTFTRIASGTPDIDIRFVSGRHSTNSFDPPFDGTGGRSNVLAHAFFPEVGDAHFDEAETWTIGTHSGINLFQVAAHEFGHSLGLAHSSVQSALMYASYHGYRPGFQLDQDDINGIQWLYGRNTAPTTAPNPPPATQPPSTPAPPTRPPATPAPPTRPPATPAPPTGPPATSAPPTRPPTPPGTTQPPSPSNVCSLSRFDAVTRTIYGRTYFFAGDYFFEYRPNNPAASRQAHLISSRWQNVNGPIEAALTRGYYTALFPRGAPFGFHGYHLFIGERRVDNYFRRTTRFLPGLPEYMDATWVWGRRSKMYASKGTRYWRYNNGNPAQDAQYPRDFNSWWSGAPDTIDAAFTDGQNRLHFVKGTTAYQFNNRVDLVVAEIDVLGQYFDCPGRRRSAIVMETVLDNNQHHEGDDGEPLSLEEGDFLGENVIDMENVVDLFTSSSTSEKSHLTVIFGLLLASLLFF